MDTPLSTTARHFSTIARLTGMSAGGVFLLLAIWVTARRLGGSFDESLSPLAVLFFTTGLVLLASLPRVLWRGAKRRRTTAGDVFLMIAPTPAVLLTAGSVAAASAHLWPVIVMLAVLFQSESVWWAVTLVRINNGGVANRPLAVSRDLHSTASASLRIDHFERPHVLDADVEQQIVRRTTIGGEQVTGMLRARFEPRERSRSLHVSFCPPLCGTPTITAEHASGVAAAIKVAESHSYGARIDLRLRETSSREESLVIAISAAVKPVLRAA